MGTIQRFNSDFSFQNTVDKAEVSFPLIGIIGEEVKVSKGHAVDSSVNPYLMQKLYAAGLSSSPDYMTFEEAANISSSQLPSFTNDTSITSFVELRHFTKITELTAAMFSGCTNLEEIDLKNITSSSRDVFKNCSKLKHVYNSGNFKVSTYGVFENCTALEELELPDGWSLPGNSPMSGCSSLKYVYTRNGFLGPITAFVNCSSLESLHFSRQINQNYNDTNGNLFKNCSSLKYIIIESYAVPVGFTAATFSNIGADNLYIFVPDISKNEYVTEWGSLCNGYATIKGISEFYTLFPDADEKFFWTDTLNA